MHRKPEQTDPITIFELVEQRYVRKEPEPVLDAERDTGSFYACPTCGQAVDKRDVEQVLHHSVPGHEPIPTD